MSKCSVDIRKDIVDAVTKRLTAKGAYVFEDSGYFGNPNISSSVINGINKEFGDLVVQEGEQGSFFIKPSDRLVQLYLDHYNKTALQLDTPTATIEASPKALRIIKEFIKAIGVDVKAVKNITVNGERMDANGAAMVMQKLIQVVEGKEVQALPEEAMHFAVEIIKQTNPKLYQQLLKEINGTKTLSEVFAQYSTNPYYQTKDGKPDVLKLKDEAIGKVLAQTIIKQAEGSIETVETKSKVQQWWDNILQWIKNLFAKSGFDQVAMDIMAGKFQGTAEDIRVAEDNVLFQLSPQATVFNKLKEVSSKIEKRDDGYYIDGKKITRRVTDLVNDWYARRFADRDLIKSDYDKAVDDLKAEKGTDGHKDIEYIFSTLVDENGKLRETPLDDSGYQSRLNPNNRDMYEVLKTNLTERLNSFPKGTVFLSEMTVYDAKRGLAGTIDFLAIEPDGKTNILDWKFMGSVVDKEAKDIPWYKVNAWRTQMDQYKLILQQVYGVKPEDFKQTRMIPIQAVYSRGNVRENILPELLSVKIGDVNVKNITEDYLLPLGLESEKTGNKKIDALIEKLNAVYKKFSEKKVLPSEKLSKAEQLNELFTAIRHLQIKGELGPLLRQAKILNKQIQSTIKKYQENFAGKDPNSLTNNEINDFAEELMTAQDALNTYVTLDSDLRSLFAGDLTEEYKKLKEDLRDAADNARALKDDLSDILDEYVDKIIAGSENVRNILAPEKVIKGITRMFSSTSTIQLKSVELLYKKANKSFALAGYDTMTENKRLLKIKEAYDKWASGKGLSSKNYFSFIKKKDKNELVDEFNPEFYKTLKKKIDEKDTKWIIDNIDVAEYNKFLKETLEKEFERIDNKHRVGTDEEIAREIRREKENAQALHSTSTYDSPGWLLYDFVKKFPNKTTWESKEWKELNKPENKAAKDFYNYIRERNEEYRELGYISSADSRVFLPFVRKSLMEKLVTGGQVKFGEQFLRSISVDEGDIGFGQIDPLTGKPIDSIPRYFTREIEGELSEDLFKTMSLYNDSAIRYKYLSDIEDQVRAIVRVEQNKKAIATSLFGKTQYKDGVLQYTPDNNENSQLVEDMMKAIIYGQRFLQSENFDQLLGKLGSWGETFNKKLGVKVFPEGLTDRQLSVNKVLNSLNNNFQLATLGLNILSAGSNYFGGNAQSIINSGKYFTRTDYLASHGMLFMNKLSNVEDQKKLIGALEYFLPLTENYNKEFSKKLALNKLSQENIQDFLMSLMRNSDWSVQTTNFYSFLKNTIVENGKLVNVREMLRAQPEFANKYAATPEQRTALDEKFENEVKRLVEEKGVLKVAKIEDNELVIPGVDRKDDSVVELRRKVQQLTKDALGNLSEDDVRMINMTVYGKSFMVFKNWIPRLVDVRLGNLKYNSASDAYEWGRMRMVFRVISEDFVGSINNLRNSLIANEKGVAFMREMFEKKKADYEKDTGKTLDMTEDQFIDLVRQNIRSQMLDVIFYATLIAMVAAIKGLAPDDDEDPAVKNQYKLLTKMADKLKDEIGYFYDPTSISSMFSSGIFPSLSLLDNAKKTVTNFMKENYYIAVGNEEMEEKNFVIKYAMRTFPFTNQMVGYLPMFYPDLAKEMGIRMQSNYGIR